MSDPTPSDYETADGWSDEQGCEICPHCGSPWSWNGGMVGPAYSQNGTEYDYYTNADANKGPFFCEGCWTELESNRKAQENRALGEFA
jgi:hypothetical protein